MANQPRVCMLVRNDCRTDYRVLKEAASATRAGYAVTIIAANTYGPLERESRDGFEIVRVPVDKGKNRLEQAFNLFPRTLRRMARAAQDVRADIYHAQDADAVLPTWIAARRAPGSRLIFDAHEPPPVSLREALTVTPNAPDLILWVLSLLNKWLVRHAFHATITVNENLADLYAKQYGIPRPAVVMNCPPRFASTAESRALLSNRLGIDPSTPIVLFQGMLTRERHGVGLENLVRSAPLLHRGVVVLMGRGPFFGQLQEMANQPPYQGKVFLLPAVPPSELVATISGAAVGVIPTHAYYSAFQYSSPNKLFEYMAVGLPVVTSSLPVIRRICEEYHCGLFCDPTSPESIADAINQALDDPELYNRLSAGALRAAQVYTWEAQEQVMLDVYRQVLGNGSPESKG